MDPTHWNLYIRHMMFQRTIQQYNVVSTASCKLSSSECASLEYSYAECKPVIRCVVRVSVIISCLLFCVAGVFNSVSVMFGGSR